jgi:thymidylate kinase
VKPILITFSGIDGAGKSTQIEKLCEYFAAQGIPVRKLAFWDNAVMFRGLRSGFSRKVLQSDGAVGTPERPANRNDKNTQAWPLLMGRSILHLLDVFHLRRVVQRAKAETASGVIIFDRYIYDQLAALPMRNSLVRAYARLMLQVAPKPDLSYVLDAVPEAARARKPEYPLDFMREYRNSYLELRKLAGLELIPAGEIDEVHFAIVDRFSKLVRAEVPTSPVSSTVIA